MKIKTITLSLIAVLFMPVLLSAQDFMIMGREGKATERGFLTYNLLKEKNAEAKKLDNTLTSVKKNNDKKVKAVKDAYAEQKRQISAKGLKKFIDDEMAAIPAEYKTKWDKMAKIKNFQGLANEVKSFGNDIKNDKYKYYILGISVKANGTGLVSLGSHSIASVILSNTDSRSYAYKQAKKIKLAIDYSGKAF